MLQRKCVGSTLLARGCSHREQRVPGTSGDALILPSSHEEQMYTILVSSSVSYKCKHFPPAVTGEGAGLYNECGGDGAGGESAHSYCRKGPTTEKRKLAIRVLNSRASEIEGAR